MSFFLLLMSFVYIVEGVLMILTPKKVIKFVHKILDSSKDARVLGLFPLVIGTLFLLCNSASAVRWLIVLLGLAGIAKAVYIFITPLTKLKAHWALSLSDNGLRAFGILVLILGVIIFIARI
jgi:uncharacterized protein YjeT (DUF2065 family)